MSRQPSIRPDGARRPRMRRRHVWMLVLAAEVLVFGAAQAVLRPVQRTGIVIETTVTPNHVVT